MGGAGTPAAQKWRDVLEARGDEKYVVCNADESEPATFKDRELLLRTPDLIIEGMALAALLVRGETRLHLHSPRISRPDPHDERGPRCRTRPRVIGRGLLGTGLSFDVEVFVSPGGYVCGEQGALIEAIEEHRAEPRNRPPQLETNGLFDKPTLLSNVETFAWVPAIALTRRQVVCRLGPQGRAVVYRERKGRRGRAAVFLDLRRRAKTRRLSKSKLARPWVELIDLAGGVRDGLPLKAVAPSGPSGGFIPAVLSKIRRRSPGPRATSRPAQESIDIRDLPLDIDEFRILESHARRRTDRLRSGRGREHARPRLERLAVLPQRVVRQVRSLPDRLAKARLDR